MFGKLHDQEREQGDTSFACTLENVSMLENLLNSSLGECGGTAGVNVPLWNWLRTNLLLRNMEQDF